MLWNYWIMKLGTKRGKATIGTGSMNDIYAVGKTDEADWRCVGKLLPNIVFLFM